MKSTDQATRCPACKTVFRVVADQLRVSEGWVRCGRCTNVFNAAENMVDMDAGWARLSEGGPSEDHRGGLPGGPPATPSQDSWQPPRAPAHRARQDGPEHDRLATKIEAAIARAQQPQQPTADSAPPVDGPVRRPPSGLTFRRSARHEPEEDTQPAEPWGLAPEVHWPPAVAETGFVHAEPEVPTSRAEEPLDGLPADWALAQATTDAATPLQDPTEAESWLPAATPAPDPTPTPAPAPALVEPSMFEATRQESSWPATPAAPQPEALRADPRNGSALLPSAKPGFMRKAEHDQRWRQPHMRALLTGAVVCGALLLLVQVTLAYRDLVAARYPASKTLLQGICAGLGCTVQAARSIDSLAVESSGLVRVDKTPLYKLQVTLRNRANLELALPALDVTFTDSRGDLIARKVLLPQDLGTTIGASPGSKGSAGGTVAAGQEVTLQGTLQTSGAAPDSVAGYTVELFYP